LSELLDKFSNIKAFVLDVDGVLTDGSILVTEDGDQLRSMNIKDGFAMKCAVENGYKICIISGGTSEGVVKRLNKLGISDVFIGVKEKLHVFNDFIQKNNLAANQVAVMGDDVPDLTLLDACGLSTCPYDAVKNVLNKCDYISPVNGGKGCVRDLIEKTMNSQGTWPYNG
jgi:3-deoxy-D-manno-octulosonate 8-phosphate phosphatase (KDO 8-P phosphatase)